MANTPGTIQVIVTGSNSFANSTVTTSQIASSYIKIGNSQPFKTFDPPPPCGLRRGGPGSKTFCEVYEQIPHTDHIGRSPSGRYFTWKGRDDE